jgi:hypothetical protein
VFIWAGDVNNNTQENKFLWADCLDKMWEPRRLTTLWAFRACYRDSFTFHWKRTACITGFLEYIIEQAYIYFIYPFTMRVYAYISYTPPYDYFELSNQWNSGFRVTLVIAHLLTKFTGLYRIQRFINIFTRANPPSNDSYHETTDASPHPTLPY